MTTSHEFYLNLAETAYFHLKKPAFEEKKKSLKISGFYHISIKHVRQFSDNGS